MNLNQILNDHGPVWDHLYDARGNTLCGFRARNVGDQFWIIAGDPFKAKRRCPDCDRHARRIMGRTP